MSPIKEIPQLFLTKLHYWLTCLLTYCMVQSPAGGANRFSASQEIPRSLWKPNVLYRIHKCPPPFPTLSKTLLL